MTKLIYLGLACVAAALGVSTPALAEAERPEIRSKELSLLDVEKAHEAEFKTKTIEFTLSPKKNPGWRLEYKLGMKAGDALVYSLSTSGEVTSEFHGEFKGSGAVMFYREDSATKATHGQFIAPADGDHGWYIANNSDKTVNVRLVVSGYFDEVPGFIKFSN